MPTRPGSALHGWCVSVAAHILFMKTFSRVADIHPDAADFAHLLPLNPDIPDFAWRIMLRYRPKANARQWAEVREFTLATALLMNPDSHDETRRLLSMTARFHVWAWAHEAPDLTPEAMYTQRRIDRYLKTVVSQRSGSHHWGTSRQLVAVGRHLTDATLHGIPAPVFAGPRPFTAPEIASMHGWARSLGTTHQRQNAAALLGLGGGAGLRPEEIINTRVEDVQVEPNGRVFVVVHGERARRVPVRNSWARVLVRALEDRSNPTDFLFVGYRFPEYPARAIQTFLTDHPAKVRPTLTRLRSSWIIHHLRNDLPLPVVQRVAGYRSVKPLLRYLDHLPEPDMAAYVGRLIGEEIA